MIAKLFEAYDMPSEQGETELAAALHILIIGYAKQQDIPIATDAFTPGAIAFASNLRRSNHASA